MPIKKRYYRRRRKIVKRKRKMPLFRPLGRNTVVTRGVFLGNLTSSTVPTFSSYQFALSDLPNNSEFTNLFDEYRILKVSIMFIPYLISTNTSANNPVPIFAYVVDKDDAGTPSSLNDLLQYPACKVQSVLRRASVKFVPRISAAVYGGPATTSYGSKVMWLDCSNSGVPHYGLKVHIGSTTAGAVFGHQIYAKYTIGLRGVR